MQPVFEDARLEAIRAKVAAGERLSYQDGLTLYRTPDLLGVGWLANQVRERLHGNQTYFNVNRHINPTDVCVASCKLCAFGKQKRDPKAYTMSLEEVWHKAGEGYSEAVTEFHIVGGLHPELTLDWYCQMLREIADLDHGEGFQVHLRKTLFQAAQHLAVPVEGQLRVQAAHDVEFRDRLAVSLASLMPDLLERHGVG